MDKVGTKGSADTLLADGTGAELPAGCVGGNDHTGPDGLDELPATGDGTDPNGDDGVAGPVGEGS